MTENNAPTDPHTAEAVVSDPDDFNRQQRFKEIHDARQRVSDYLANFETKLFDHDRTHSAGTVPVHMQEQLAFRVSLYVMELLPLLKKKAGEDPYMSRRFDNTSNVNSLEHYAFKSGMLGKTENRRGEKKETGTPVLQSMQVFQVANFAYADLGMDLEIAEEQGDAGFDYTDILEEGPPGDRPAPEIKADGEKKPAENE